MRPPAPEVPPTLADELSAAVSGLVDAVERESGPLAPQVLDHMAELLQAEMILRGHTLKLYPDVPLRERYVSTLVSRDLATLDRLLAPAVPPAPLREWVAFLVSSHTPYDSMSMQHLNRLYSKQR